MKVRRKISRYWNESEKENEQTIGMKMNWREKKKEMKWTKTVQTLVYILEIYLC